MTSEPKKRIRKKSLRIQLQSALRDAEAAGTADVSTQKLIQTRLTVLNKMMGRERAAKLERAVEQLAAVQAENIRLRSQHDADAAEIERLRAVCRLGTSTTFDDIAKIGRTNGTR
jgi:hypothetical protein